MAKTKKIAITNYEECEQAIAKMATIDLAYSKKKADIETEIEKLKAIFILEFESAQTDYCELEKAVITFAKKNRNDFLEKRSKEFTNGRILFRIGNPTVTFLPGINEESALANDQAIFESKHTRTINELDKQLLLSKFATGKISEEELQEIGVRITQKETVKVEVIHSLKEFSEVVK